MIEENRTKLVQYPGHILFLRSVNGDQYEDLMWYFNITDHIVHQEDK